MITYFNERGCTCIYRCILIFFKRFSSYAFNNKNIMMFKDSETIKYYNEEEKNKIYYLFYQNYILYLML